MEGVQRRHGTASETPFRSRSGTASNSPEKAVKQKVNEWRKKIVGSPMTFPRERLRERGQFRGERWRPGRSRGNAGSGERFIQARRHWPAETCKNGPPCARQPADVAPLSGSALRSARGQAALKEAGGIRVSQQTARRLACDAALVKMQHGPGGEIPGRRPQDADHFAGPAQGAGGARPAVPVSGLPEPPLRRASRAALGRRRRYGARQSRIAVPPPSPGGARGGVPHQTRRNRTRGIRPARRPPASRRAPAPAARRGNKIHLRVETRTVVRSMSISILI